jgi:hypothetical protein
MRKQLDISVLEREEVEHIIIQLQNENRTLLFLNKNLESKVSSLNELIEELSDKLLKVREHIIALKSLVYAG